MSSDNWMPPEEFAQAAQMQREWLNDMADKIEAGEPLETRLDRKVAAGVLRAWAKQIPAAAPRRKGHPPQFNTSELAWDFALLVNVYGRSKHKAHQELAEHRGVSVEAVRKALRKHPDALELMPRNPNLKRK
jgi:hypothetical protein